MAKLYALPEEVGPCPQWSNDGTYVNRVDAWEQRIADWCRARGHSGDLIGKVIRFSVADGYARYIVVTQKGGLGLANTGEGDGYSIHPATIRGLRVSDVRSMLKREEALRALFSKKA